MRSQARVKKSLMGLKAVRKPRSIGDAAYTSLREAIVKGDLLPGQRLVESTLSGQMKMSRIPVREAIKKLEQDGLVERLVEKGGFVVKDLSREDIKETFGIRAVLEGYAARLATGRMDDATIGRLEEILEFYRKALEVHDIQQMVQANNQLDDIIFEACGSRTLRALISNYRDFVSRYRRLLLNCLENAASSLSEHKEIVEAMKQGDAEKVEGLFRRHLFRGRNIILAKGGVTGD